MNKADEKNSNSRPRPRGARPWQAAAVAVALAVTALLAAACGGGGSHGPGSGSGSDQNLAAAMDSYASCIRSHGVPDFYFTRQNINPSPPPYGAVIGVDGYTFVFDSTLAYWAAEKVCKHLAPFRSTPPRDTHQEFLNALKSAECMRSHGYPDWPDPNPTRPGFMIPGSIDTNSTQFQAVAKTCGLGAPPGS
jgi:hypothetical protein